MLANTVPALARFWLPTANARRVLPANASITRATSTCIDPTRRRGIGGLTATSSSCQQGGKPRADLPERSQLHAIGRQSVANRVGDLHRAR